MVDPDECLRRVRGRLGPITATADTLAAILDSWDRSTKSPLVQAALLVAVHAHQGQVDKSGKPYVLHPLRVMLYGPATPEHQAAALLHDVVEDTPVTLADLEAVGFPLPVVVAVDHLTQRKDAETHTAYIVRCARDPLARAVKYADLRDNMDPVRMDVLGSRSASLMERYRKSLDLLRESD